MFFSRGAGWAFGDEVGEGGECVCMRVCVGGGWGGCAGDGDVER